MNLTSKEYLGTVLAYKDEVEPNKVYVDIPELNSTSNISNNRSTPISVSNPLTYKFINMKDENGNVVTSGSYYPIKPGTDVYIKFRTDNINSGYITGLGDRSSGSPVAVGSSPNDSVIIYADEKNRIYLDPQKDRFHISTGTGKTDFFMDSEGIIMQCNAPGGEYYQSYLELSPQGFVIKIGEKTLLFNESGFAINQGKDSGTSFIMTNKGVTLSADKYIKFSTQGEFNIYGENTYIQGESDMNVKGNVTKISGNQRAAINSSVVHINSWLDTHVKAGLNLSLEGQLKMSSRSILHNENTLGIKNSYGTLNTETKMIHSNSTLTGATGTVTGLEDGLKLKDMGLGVGVSSSTNATVNTSFLGIELGMAGLTTLFSFDNIASAIAGFIMNENTTGDVAVASSSLDDILFGNDSGADKGQNSVNKLNKIYFESVNRQKQFLESSANADLYI